MSDLLNTRLVRHLAPSIAGDAIARAIIEAVDSEHIEVVKAIPEVLILPRIDVLPEAVIDLLAWQYHADFYRPDLPLDVKRKLVKGSIPWHRKKGTPWAVKKALLDLGFTAAIKEWFELGTKPHTFSVTVHYTDDPSNIFPLGVDTESILIEAVKEAKPVRSHLLFLVVAPPPIDLSDHICRWDWCTWDHGAPRIYDWPTSVPAEGILDSAGEIGITITRAITGFYSREDRWDVDLWDHGRHRDMVDRFGAVQWTALIAEWDDYHPEPVWYEHRNWECESTWEESCEEMGGRGFFRPETDTTDEGDE